MMKFLSLKHHFIVLILIGLCFSGCRNKVDPLNENLEYHYLHLSHTRTRLFDAVLMDSIVETKDFSKYDMLLLGGDLAWNTSGSVECMDNVDSHFDLSSINTLWTIGNHDINDMDLLEAYTGRPPFYASYKNGLCFIVFNTMDSSEFISNEQLALFNSVMDTLQMSSHLIILTHHLVWMYGNSDLEELISETSNAPFGTCSYCLKENNFYETIYPRLLEARQNGIEVLCIAGDLGVKAKEFEFITAEGVNFLASGIYEGDAINRALILDHFPNRRKLFWYYMDLEKL